MRIVRAFLFSLSLVWAFSSYAQTNHLSLNTDSILDILRSGSTDKITENRMNKGLVINSLDALNGRAAGVNIASSGAERMAMLSSVRVRGTTSLTGGNDPLVIIDGVSADLATLSSIYPADIESFTILKNAAETAQYGSRGASGVIVVSTKKGHGAQFHISYDSNMGFESVYKNIKMLRREGYISTAKALGLSYNDGGFDSDFPAAITRTGMVQNHHMAFSGGTESSNYRASLGFMKRNTVIKIVQYDNFVAKIDLSQRAFDNLLTVDFGVFGSSVHNNNIFDVQQLFYSAATQNPTISTGTNNKGNWEKNSTASQINHPLALLKEKNDEKSMNFNTHLKLTFDISRDLKLTLFGSYSYNSTENPQFCPTWVWAQGQAYRGEHKQEDWLGNLTLHFQHTWGAHCLTANLLGEYQKSNKSGFWTLVKGFTTNLFGYDNLAAGATIPYGGTGSSYESPALGSLMGGLTYTLSDRYSLTLTMRAVRAMFYYYLMDMFGNVPLVVSEGTPIKNIKQSSRSRVFRFVFDELQTVAPLLPNEHSNREGAYYGRITRPVAWFLLAKLALNAEIYADDDWTDGTKPDGRNIHFTVANRQLNAWQTVQCYADSIASAGYSLEDNYTKNFSVHNENSVENIFTIPMNKIIYANQFQYLFRSRHYRHGDALGMAAENGTSATVSTVETYGYGTNNTDTRYALNFYSDTLRVDGNIVYLGNAQPLVYMPLEVKLDLTGTKYEKTAGARMSKYEIDRTAYADGKLQDNDIVLFRYADVLLMAAEAKVRNGQNGNAEFNRVRGRVGMPARSATLKNILDERLMELMWEGWRRQDLIRFSKFSSPYDQRPQLAGESSAYTTVFPIPHTARKLNLNLKQNPGYK